MTKAIGLVVLATLSVAAAQRVDPLTRARQLYNAQRFEEAISAAAEARQVPELADAAAVVSARARLERYRESSEADDLVVARQTLQQVNADKLTPRDYLELLIGLGESLYFDDRYGAAAELFEQALVRSELLDVMARERLLEWWAGALDRQAQFGPESERKPLYSRILQRAESELRRNDRSAVALYWQAAAARGTDDLEHAWSAALAAWVRAPLTGARGGQLRSDLDKLVTDVIIPERAIQRASGGDPRAEVESLLKQWDDHKQKWPK